MADEIEAIRNWVIAGKRKEALEATSKALAAGVDPGTIMKDSLIGAMSIVGQKFSSGEFFLPQMMIAARAMTEVVHADQAAFGRRTPPKRRARR